MNPSSVSEGAGATEMTVTATFSNASTYGSATTVTVSVGDAKDSATSGADYAAVTDFDIAIAAGASSGKGTFTLTPKQDYAIEGSEKITLGGTATGLTVNAASISLTDEAPPAIHLSVDPASVPEGAGATAVTVTATFSNSVTYGSAKT